MSLKDELLKFLETTFPGSTIYDGYYFVRIEAPHERLVRDDMYQMIVDKLCDAGCWMVCVGTDPTGSVRAKRVEQETVAYNPDWNVSEPMTQWLVELQPGAFTLRDITSRLSLTSALVLVDPRRRIVFHVNLARVYAPSQGDLASFEHGIEAAFEPQR